MLRNHLHRKIFIAVGFPYIVTGCRYISIVYMRARMSVLTCLNQIGKKLIKHRGHTNAGAQLMTPMFVDILYFLRDLRLIVCDNSIVRGKLGHVHQHLCICPIEANPAVFPQVLRIRLLADRDSGIDQKRITSTDTICLAVDRVGSFSFCHIMQDIKIIDPVMSAEPWCKSLPA